MLLDLYQKGRKAALTELAAFDLSSAALAAAASSLGFRFSLGRPLVSSELMITALVVCCPTNFLQANFGKPSH